MENVAKYPKYTFLHARARMENLYPVKMSEDRFIEKAYITWLDLPDRHTSAHVYIGEVGADNQLELPENVEYISAVTLPSYIKDSLYGLNYFYYYNGSVLYDMYFDNIEWDSYRMDKSLSDRYGSNVTFNLLEDNVITFPQGDFSGNSIAVLYKGLIVDDNCDPLLYKNEISAIAANVAYMDFRFSALNMEPGKDKMLSFLKQEAEIAMAKAGIAENITQNQIDQMLNVAVSMDRKVYNSNYKFRS